MIHTQQNFAIINARAILEDRIMNNAVIIVKDGIITSISQNPLSNTPQKSAVFDAAKKIAGPGLIDMHIHGCGGTDTATDCPEQSLLRMADFLCEQGITSFQPAMVMNLNSLRKIATALNKNPALATRIPGVYVEGPFVCPEKKGGLPAESLSAFSASLTEEIVSITFTSSAKMRCVVKTMTIAPELTSSQTLEKLLADSGILSAWGHSNAFLPDIDNRKPLHLTHLFNAMNGIDHRKPGLAILPFTRQGENTTFEIICDTVHVHPAVLELVFTSKAAQNACIISDCMSSGGMGKGESLYLNRHVVCDGRVSRYKDNRVLIGSAMLVSETTREIFTAGLIDERQFFRAASTNPARVLGMNDRGVLAVGKKADIVLCKHTMEITDIFSH